VIRKALQAQDLRGDVEKSCHKTIAYVPIVRRRGIFSPSRAASIAWLLPSVRQAMAPIPCPHSHLESGPLPPRPAIKEEAPVGDEIKKTDRRFAKCDPAQNKNLGGLLRGKKKPRSEECSEEKTRRSGLSQKSRAWVPRPSALTLRDPLAGALT
jgi:hypothetical protein